MTHDDMSLEQLADQVARKRQLKAQAQSLEKQLSALKDKVRELDRIRYREESDVERLQGRSLSRFIARLRGDYEGRLSREQSQAHAAVMKYEAAQCEVHDIQQRLAEIRKQLSDLSHCEYLYAQALEEKLERVKAEASPLATQIRQLEEEALRLETQKKEINEALSTGRTARQRISAALQQLSDANGLATWDVLGGGLLVDLAKHDALDTAQTLVEAVQLDLRRFKTELADVQIEASLQVNTEGFLRFADYFFDGLLTDFAVKEHISRSCEQLETLSRQLAQMLSRLENLLSTAQQKQAAIRSQIDNIVRKA